MENCCGKLLFCEAEPGRRTVAVRYFLCDAACLENCCKVLFCDAEQVWRTIAGRYCFVIQSRSGEQLQEGIFLR